MKIYQIKSARKDNEVVKKGQPYWFCYPKNVGKKSFKSLEECNSWITSYARSFRGEHSCKMEEFEMRKGELELLVSEGGSDWENDKQALLDDIDEWKSEKEDNLYNLPDSLQESSVINEQIEELETLYSEVEELEYEA